MAKIIGFNKKKKELDEERDLSHLTPEQQRKLEHSRRIRQAERKDRAKEGAKATGALVITVVILLIAVLCIIFRDSLNIDSVRRFIAYQGLDTDETGQSEQIVYENNSLNCYAQVDNNLLVCSGTLMQLFSSSGKEYFSQMVTMEAPAVQAAGSYAVAFDVGGTEFYGVSGKDLSWSDEVDGSILNARVNETGYLTMVSQQTGYKGVVTAYSAAHDALVQENISSAYVMDGAISNDGRFLAVVTVEEADSIFCSTVTFYDADTGESINSVRIEDQLEVDLNWDSEGLWVQTDSGMAYITVDGGIQGSWQDTDNYLRGYTFTDNGYQVMVWSQYKTGYQGYVVLVDSTGQKLNTISVSNQVISVSSAGDYLNLLFTNELQIYDKDLNLYSSLTDTAGSRRVFARSDGSALMVGAENASLYVP